MQNECSVLLIINNLLELIAGFMGFLDKITGLFKKNKCYVGIFISPRSFVEIVKFNSETNTVIQHARTDLAYDSVTRQISNISEFETGIINLYEQLEIPFNTPAVLSLQTVYLGHSSLPMELDDSEIKSVIAEQLENNFIFRNSEPEICYETITAMQETNTVHLAYTAIQKDSLINLEESLKRVGVNIVAIDTSYASLLRGLVVAGICTEDINECQSWTVLLVNNNNVVLISMVGNKLVDFSEIPVVIKSFESKEVYTVINSYTNDAITTQAPDHLLIISKSEEISAERLASTFNLNCKITFVDDNLFSDENLETVNAELETIGACFWNKSEISLSFNFLSRGSSVDPVGTKIKIGNFTFYLTPKLLQNIIIGVMVFSVILIVGIIVISSAIISSMERKYEDLAIQKSKLESEISAASVQPEASSDVIIGKVFEKNGKILQSYNSIGAVIPEKLWIEAFGVNNDLNSYITGKAYSVDDIVSYYQNLLRSAQFQNFKITSIKVIDGDQSQDSGVNITQNNDPSNSGKNESVNSLPNISNIPNLPSVSTQRHYQFVFGNPITPPTPGTSAAAPAATSENPAPPTQ